jgi:hypothetical protein
VTSPTTTYPMRVSPDGVLIAIRDGDEPHPWRVGGRRIVIFHSDEQVEDWTPLVPQPAAGDDLDQLARLGDSPRYGIRLDNDGGPDSSETAWEHTQRMVVSPDKYARIAAIVAESDSGSTDDAPRRGATEISMEIITALEQSGIPVYCTPRTTDVHTVPYRWTEDAGPGAAGVYQWKTLITTDEPATVATIVRALPDQRVVVEGAHAGQVVVFTNTPIPQA